MCTRPNHVPLENSFVRADIIILSLPTGRRRVAPRRGVADVVRHMACTLRIASHAAGSGFGAHDEARHDKRCLMTKLR